MRFDVKKDRWIIALILLPLGVGFIAIFSSLAFTPTDSDTAPTLVPFFIFLFMGALIWQIYAKSYYLLDEQSVRIFFGPFKLRILYTSITDIKPSKNILSGMALSLDRVAIYKNGHLWQLISPVDKMRFIEEVKKRANL